MFFLELIFLEFSREKFCNLLDNLLETDLFLFLVSLGDRFHPFSTIFKLYLLSLAQ